MRRCRGGSSPALLLLLAAGAAAAAGAAGAAAQPDASASSDGRVVYVQQPPEADAGAVTLLAALKDPTASMLVLLSNVSVAAEPGWDAHVGSPLLISRCAARHQQQQQSQAPHAALASL